MKEARYWPTGKKEGTLAKMTKVNWEAGRKVLPSEVQEPHEVALMNLHFALGGVEDEVKTLKNGAYRAAVTIRLASMRADLKGILDIWSADLKEAK